MCSDPISLDKTLHILGSLFYLFYIYSKIMEHILFNFSFYYIYYSLSKRVSLLCTICTHIQNHRSFLIHHHKEECDIKVAMCTKLLPIFSKRFSYCMFL